MRGEIPVNMVKLKPIKRTGQRRANALPQPPNVGGSMDPQSSNPRTKKQCPICGTWFKVKPSIYERRTTCSMLCRSKLQSQQRSGKPSRMPQQQRTPKLCKVDGCKARVHSRGLCKNHHWRLLEYGDPLFDDFRRNPVPREFQADRTKESEFWPLVEKSSECWNWMGKKNNKGYGQFSGGLTHRYSYALHRGMVPEGFIVQHSCDNPSCVNPNHLSLGTYRSNYLDMVEKGRWPTSFAPKDRATKFSKRVVLRLRQDFDTGNFTITELARRYEVSPTHARRIVKRESRSDV